MLRNEGISPVEAALTAPLDAEAWVRFLPIDSLSSILIGVHRSDVVELRDLPLEYERVIKAQSLISVGIWIEGIGPLGARESDDVVAAIRQRVS